MLTPAFSFTNSETRTLNTAIDFTFDLSSYSLAVCKAAYSINQDAGFSAWLGQVVSSISKATAGPPYASLQNYDFDSDFTVKSGSSIGADATISIVKVSASVAAANSDVHHMKITIAAVHRDGSGKPQPGGPPFRPMGPGSRPFSIPTN